LESRATGEEHQRSHTDPVCTQESQERDKTREYSVREQNKTACFNSKEVPFNSYYFTKKNRLQRKDGTWKKLPCEERKPRLPSGHCRNPNAQASEETRRSTKAILCMCICGLCAAAAQPACQAFTEIAVRAFSVKEFLSSDTFKPEAAVSSSHWGFRGLIPFADGKGLFPAKGNAAGWRLCSLLGRAKKISTIAYST